MTLKQFSFITCFLAIASSATAEVINTVAHLDQQHQVIQEFGASDCWLGDYIGRYFSSTMRERAAKLLFATSFNRGGSPEGIGLSNWRVNLGAGSSTQGDESNIEDVTRRAECFLNSDGVTYNWNAASGQQYFMQKAREYGVQNILLFSNSAPIYYTSNGKACRTSTLPWGSNLRSDAYDDFAEYLATVAKHFIDQGYHISYISPVNEPQYEWVGGQEGSPWTNTEVAQLCRELDNSLSNRGLETQILIPEAGQWTHLTNYMPLINNYGYDQINQFFNPANSNTYIGNLPHVAHAVAGHSYWTFRTNDDLTNVRRNVASAAAARGLQVFQTEWSMLDEPPMASAGFPAGGYDEATYMDIALFMGKLIYCDLVNAGAVSWSYWTAFAQEQWGWKNRFCLLRVTANGDTGPESYGSLTNGGSIVDNRNLWVLGNYSRFIRPGYRRVELSGASDLNALMGSAYVSPNGDELVVVYVNMAYESQQVEITTAGDNRTIASIKSYTTSESLALHRDNSLPTEYQGQALEIPARSVVTLVMSLESPVTQPARGDLNGDGNVDVTDVSTLIDVVLSKPVTLAEGAVTDLNGDGNIDVTDVSLLIDIVLGKAS